MTTDKTQGGGGGAVVVASVTPTSNKKNKSEKKMTAGRSASGTNGKNVSSPANNVNINVNVMHPNHHHQGNNKSNQNGHWNNQHRQHHRHNNSNKNNPNHHPHGNFHHQQGGNGNGNGNGWYHHGNNVPPQFWNPHQNGHNGMMMPMNGQGYVPGFVPPSHGNGYGYHHHDGPYYPPHQQQEMYYGTAAPVVVAQGFVAPMMAMGQFMAHNQNFGGHGGGYGGGGYDGSYYGPNDGSFYPMNMNQCYDEQGYMMDPAAYEYDQQQGQEADYSVEQEQLQEPDQQPPVPVANDDDNLKNNQSDYQYSTPQKASGATTASWEEDDTTMASTFATTQTQNGDEDDVVSNSNSNKHKEEEEEDPIDQDVVVQQLFPPLESIQWQLPHNDSLHVLQQPPQQLNLNDDQKKTLLLGCKTLVKIRDATITLTDPNSTIAADGHGNAPRVDMTLSQFLMLERDLELTFFDTPKVLKAFCEEQQRLLDANNNNNNTKSNGNKKLTKKQHKKQLQALEQIMNVAQTIVNHLDLAMHVMDLARFQFYAGGGNNNNKATPLPKITHYTPPTVRFLLRDYVDAETGQPNGRLASANTTLERLRRDLHLETIEDCRTLPRWGCTNLLFQFSALQWLDNPHVRTRLQELSAAHVIPTAFLNYVPYSKKHTTETSQGLVAIYLGLVSPSRGASFRIRNLPWMANRPVWVDHHNHHLNNNNINNVIVEKTNEEHHNDNNNDDDDKTAAKKTQTKEEGPAAVSNNKKNKEEADESDKTEDGQLSYSEEQFPPLPAASTAPDATATEPNNGNKNNNNKPKKYFHRGNKKNRKAKKKTEQKQG